jgi:hypothetical protein
MYTDVASLRLRSLQVCSGPAVHSPLLLLGVKGGPYVGACFLELQLCFSSCLLWL